MSQVWAYLSVTALTLTGLLLVFIILLQRGRGGGLAGAFGGAGGQSALGTKAGDVFTKITVGLAVFWVFLACLSIYALRASTEIEFGSASDTTADSTVSDGNGEREPEIEPVAPPSGDVAVEEETGTGAETPAGETTDNPGDAGPALGTPSEENADEAAADADAPPNP
ncbi:MAG: preprotein translocase subunit SecG [Planctomycetaceae bacterium]